MVEKKEIIADLQIHSKHARATSKNISIENLERYARMKGLKLLGVGDFQHPLRRKEESNTSSDFCSKQRDCRPGDRVFRKQGEIGLRWKAYLRNEFSRSRGI